MPRIMRQSESRFLSFAKHPSHNPWLDLLRSLAIILVLLRHGSHTPSSGLNDGYVANFFVNGWVGVDLFFVLSGYLIAGGLIRRGGETGALFPRRYFIDRILRIVPAYYAVLAFCLLGIFPGFTIYTDDLGQSVLAHLLFLQDYTGANINVVFWSLGVEEKFYILAPALILILLKCPGKYLCGLVILALLLISPILRGATFEGLDETLSYSDFFAMLRSPFHMSLEGFIVGIAVAILQSNGVRFSSTVALTGLICALAVLTIWLGSHEFMSDITRIDAWVQPTALSLLFGFMVMCAVSLFDQPLPAEPFFRVNARLSYALYLVHFPLVPLAIHFGQDWQGPGFWTVYLALSYAFALLAHFAVEKPFLRLKQKLNDRHHPSAPVRTVREVLP